MPQNKWCSLGLEGCTGDGYCQSMSRSQTFCRNCYAAEGYKERERWLMDRTYRATADASSAAISRANVEAYKAKP
jgi:hypothetical protein